MSKEGADFDISKLCEPFIARDPANVTSSSRPTYLANKTPSAMGKRKSSQKPMGPKKSDPLPTTFTCLFCNHEKSVAVKLDRKAGVGQLDCRVCGQKFQCAVNYLSAAVDVYGEWVDAADAVAKEDNGQSAFAGETRAPASRRYSSGRATTGEDGDERRYEGDGTVVDDEEY